MRFKLGDALEVTGELSNVIEISKAEYDTLAKKAFLYDLIYGYTKAKGYTPDEYLISFEDVIVDVKETEAEHEATDCDTVGA